MTDYKSMFEQAVRILAGKMIASAKVQVEYFALRKESPRIKFLEAAE